VVMDAGRRGDLLDRERCGGQRVHRHDRPRKDGRSSVMSGEAAALAAAESSS
jgi:hypothetical protein